MQPVSGVSSTFAVWTEGSGRVVIKIYERQTVTGLKYFAPHKDERTSICAAKTIIDRLGGRLVELCHSGGRDIQFSIVGERAYKFDPNRMFSDDGAKKSLEERSEGHSSRAAIAAVRRLAGQCLDALRITEGRLVIGAHNNSDTGPNENTFSILSYCRKPEFKSAAEYISINLSHDFDDFFFVTERSDYDYVVGKGYNAVLSKARPSEDNGSLGVYCAFQRIPYANSEAQCGKFDFQKKMYEVLHDRPGPAVA